MSWNCFPFDISEDIRFTYWTNGLMHFNVIQLIDVIINESISRQVISRALNKSKISIFFGQPMTFDHYPSLCLITQQCFTSIHLSNCIHIHHLLNFEFFETFHFSKKKKTHHSEHYSFSFSSNIENAFSENFVYSMCRLSKFKLLL